MALTKKQRQEVWNKSDGHCWYCGSTLPEKGWHADHVEPIYRDKKFGTQKPRNDIIENIVPACATCNLFKNVFNLEQFRYELSRQVDRARETSINFRMAEKFEQIEATRSPIVFWFEYKQKSPPSR